MPLNSALYTGTVWHRRAAPRAHTLNYRVAYFLLDPREREALTAASRLFAWNRPAWFSFRDTDHGAGDGTPFEMHVAAVLREAGLESPDWRLRVLCMPRVLGYVFNPITVVYCYDEGRRLAATLYEVNNTFGERISYVVPVTREAAVMRQRCSKAMFVSPFFDLSGYYDFRLTAPGPHLGLAIDYRGEDGSRRLRAVFSGKREPWSAAALRRAALRYPAATVKVIGAIHYEALKLWLKGVPLAGRTAPAAAPHSIGTER